MSALPDERPPTPEELAELMQPGADWERDGFHPTMNRPFPSMQCVGVVKSGPNSGLRCNKRALYGATVCLSHGAQLPVVRAKAERLVEAARLKLLGHADEAVEWLLDLGANSTSDAVRLKASTEVLDRVGVRGGVDIQVQHEVVADPAELLRNRLDTLQRRTIEGQVLERGDTVVESTPATEEPTDGQP